MWRNGDHEENQNQLVLTDSIFLAIVRILKNTLFHGIYYSPKGRWRRDDNNAKSEQSCSNAKFMALNSVEVDARSGRQEDCEMHRATGGGPAYKLLRGSSPRSAEMQTKEERFVNPSFL